MAGDWIKMRGALLDHPKTIAIARALQANRDFRDWLTPGGGGGLNGQIASDSALRCVTVALLMKIWSGSREHGTFVGNDLHLRYSVVDDLDQMAGVPGVGMAMASVGWVVDAPGGVGIILPNFKEFNVPMTPAEKQSAYRKRLSESVTNPLPSSGNKKVTRVEKSREDLKPTPSLRSGAVKGNGELIEHSPPKNPTPSQVSKGVAWDAFEFAYLRRYGTAPVRNARVNSQMAKFVQCVGGGDAPGVAEFYLAHNDARYVREGHSVGMLVAHAEKLRTEWATGRRVTVTAAQHGDKLQAAGDVFTKLIGEAHESTGT